MTDDYVPETWTAGETFTPEAETAVSQQLDIQQRLIKGKFHHDFTKDPNGPVPAISDSGQTLVINYATIAEATANIPSISGGKLINTNTSSGTAASYIAANLNAPITYAEADVEIGNTGSTHTSSWGLTAMSGQMSTSAPSGPAHVIFSNDHFDWGVSNAGTITVVRTVFYSAISGQGKKTIAIALDQANNTAYVRDPWGRVHKIVDTGIGAYNCNWIWFEPFFNAANTDDRLFGYRVSADTTPFNHQGPMVSKAQQLAHEYDRQNSSWRVTSVGTAGASTSFGFIAVPGVSGQAIVPPSGKILARMSVSIGAATACTLNLLMAYDDGLGSTGSVEQAVASMATSEIRYFQCEFILSGLVAGHNYVITPMVKSTQTNTQIHIFPPPGVYQATLVLEPVS